MLKNLDWEMATFTSSLPPKERPAELEADLNLKGLSSFAELVQKLLGKLRITTYRDGLFIDDVR